MCLVLTDDCLQSLGIRDATCVIHFSFPSPGVFGQRLQSMSDNFCTGIKVWVNLDWVMLHGIITGECINVSQNISYSF